MTYYLLPRYHQGELHSRLPGINCQIIIFRSVTIGGVIIIISG